MDYFLSLDLGRTSEHSALAIVRRSLIIADGLPRRDRRGELVFEYGVVHGRRYPKGTPYPEIIGELKGRILPRPELQPPPRLLVNATYVGRAVVDLVLEAGLGLEVVPLIITGGDEVRWDGWPPSYDVRGWWVAKHQLVSAVQAALQAGRLKIADIPHEPGAVSPADTLRRELKAFSVRQVKAAGETYAVRESADEDLLVAAAMPVLVGGQRPTFYTAEAADGPERAALTAEGQIQEAAERAAFARERQEVEAQRRREWAETGAWVRIGGEDGDAEDFD